MKIKNTLLIFVVLNLAVCFGQQEQEADIDFEILKNLELFEMVYKNIDLHYVDESNPGELMRSGIESMLAELDPYTNYIPESRMEEFKLMTTGQYGGIGAVIRAVKDEVMVIEPYENFPAHKAGLMAGDIFIEINGKSVEGFTSSQVSEKLKGQPGKELKLKISRQGTPMDITLVREEIKMDAVPYHGLVGDKIGYIKLNSFTRTAAKEVYAALVDLQKNQAIEKLIFDLRGNGGGLLDQSAQIVNFFVEKGSDIVKIKGRMEGVNKSYVARANPVDMNIPIVVLVDGGSASASEIVSGAFQDLDRAVVLGETTFGKGLVQRPFDLKYNAKIKVTIAKYYTPSGRCIQKLDYTNKKVGEHAAEVSDATLTEFKTKNGRTVIDGRGVEPDVPVSFKAFSRLTSILVFENIIFNFATDFKYNHENIEDVQNFKLNDQIFEDFKKYALSKEFEYSTVASEMLKELKEEVERKGLYEESSEVYNQLYEFYKPSKERDLDRYKSEIISLLEDEIVGRYYHQKGRISHALISDEFILEAVKILNDPMRYKTILNIQN